LKFTLQNPSRAARIILSAGLFAATLLNYRPWRGYRHDQEVDFGTEPIRIARSMYESGTFADPFAAAPTGKTAHIAPGFPALLWVILRAAGERGPAELLVQALPVVAIGVELSLMPWIAELLGLSFWTGAAGSALAIVYKPGPEPQWEGHLAALLSMLAVAALWYWRRVRGIRAAAAAGLIGGVLFLFSPVCAVPWIAQAGLAALRRRTIAADSAAMLLTLIVVCLPWGLRNYIDLGEFAIRDNLGIEMHVSYNDCAHPTFEENLEYNCIQRFHPNSSLAEALALRSAGEVQYNHERLRAAFDWIASNQGASAELLAQRFLLFWFPEADAPRDVWTRFPRHWIRPIITLASFAGLYLLWRQRSGGFGLFAAWLLLFPPVYYVIQSAPRYRYPILWMSWLLAACAAEHLIRHGLLWLPHEQG
jgi:hypothetical protein